MAKLRKHQGPYLSNVIESPTPIRDACPIFTRIKAYTTQMGMTPVLSHTVRDEHGEPMDLSDYFGRTGKPTDDNILGKLVLRGREILSPVGPRNPIIESFGTCIDPTEGVIHFPLPKDLTTFAGIYQLSLMITDGVPVQGHAYGFPLKMEAPLLWVERSLFPHQGQRRVGQFSLPHGIVDLGPPSMVEIRQVMVDSGQADNSLLRSVEFSNDQLCHAVSRPIDAWNTEPPPLRPDLDTRNFPFREDWLKAICGHLQLMAADNYRRNHLPYQAGGMSIDDKNKEGPYMSAGQRLTGEWLEFVRRKKYELNVQLMQGTVRSSYMGIFFH